MGQALPSLTPVDLSPPISGGAADLCSSAAAVAGCSGEKLYPQELSGSIVVAGVARRGGCWGCVFILLLLFYFVFFVILLCALFVNRPRSHRWHCACVLKQNPDLIE